MRFEMRQIVVKQIPYLDKISKESSMENVFKNLKLWKIIGNGAGSGVASYEVDPSCKIIDMYKRWQYITNVKD